MSLLKTFVMTRGRTGSTAILDELGRAAGCRSENEPFTRSTDPTLAENFPTFDFWREQNLQLAGMLSEPRSASVYLQILHGDAEKQGAGALFWKALSQHFDERAYLRDLVKTHNYRAVYLTRGAVRQVLSGLTARERQLYNTREDFSDSRRYRIDVDEFRMLAEWERHSVGVDRQFLTANGFDFIEVSYEHYLADRAGFFGRIFGFLGMPEVVPAPSDFKIMIDDLRARIENYDEVEAVAVELGEPL